MALARAGKSILHLAGLHWSLSRQNAVRRVQIMKRKADSWQCFRFGVAFVIEVMATLSCSSHLDCDVFRKALGRIPGMD